MFVRRGFGPARVKERNCKVSARGVLEGQIVCVCEVRLVRVRGKS